MDRQVWLVGARHLALRRDAGRVKQVHLRAFGHAPFEREQPTNDGCVSQGRAVLENVIPGIGRK